VEDGEASRSVLGVRHDRAQSPESAAVACTAGPTAPGCCPAAQGLDWFRASLLRDSDGDCAHCFLEEPSRQQQQRARGKEGAQLGRDGSSGTRSPVPKQQRGSVLQNCSRRAQLAGPSDMMLHQGNVYVTPHD
jgi:hypothetical protein